MSKKKIRTAVAAKVLVLAITLALAALLCAARLTKPNIDPDLKVILTEARTLEAAIGETQASESALGAFELLYSKRQSYLSLLQSAENRSEKARAAFAPFQIKIRDPAEQIEDLNRARAAVWRTIGENTDARLLVPALGIDTALKKTTMMTESEVIQAIVDDPGFTAWMIESGWGENVLADHRSQDFGGLLLAQPGTPGFIAFPDGRILEISCAWTENGRNDGVLRNLDGDVLQDAASWLLYTCRQDSVNIRITGWEPVHIYKTDTKEGSIRAE